MTYRTSIETPYEGQTLYTDGDAVAPSLRQVYDLMAQAREARARAARELAAVVERTESTLRVEQWRPDGVVIKGTIAPDPLSAGRWMLERADAAGPINATGYTSLTAAIEDALREGFVLGVPPHAVESVRVEVVIDDGDVTSVAARVPTDVLAIRVDTEGLTARDVNGVMVRKDADQWGSPHRLLSRTHSEGGDALGQFARLDALARMGARILRAGIAVEALRPFLTCAIQSGRTACGALDAEEACEEAAALLTECAGGERGIETVLAVIKDGGAWGALGAMVEEAARVKRMLAFPCEGPETRETLVEWAHTAGIRIEDDPDQPGWVIWRSADGEACDVSEPSRGEAARAALAHLFPHAAFVEQFVQPGACRQYDVWLATCRGDVASSIRVCGGPGM